MKNLLLVAALLGAGALCAATPVQAGGFGSRAIVKKGRFAKVAVINGHRVGFNSVRVNAFGTRTFVDNSGRIFEVDFFGNARFRGNAFTRGFARKNAFFFSKAVNRGFFGGHCTNGFSGFGY